MQASAGRARTAGLWLLCGGTMAIGAAYAGTIATRAAPEWAAWCLVAGSAATPVGLFVLGASRRGRLSPLLRAVFAAVFVMVGAAFGAALVLPSDEGAGARLLLGLPLRTAIVFYGVGFLPLALLPLAYGLSFSSDVLTAEDLARVRAGGATRG